MQEAKIIKNIFPCKIADMVNIENNLLLAMSDVNVGFCSESSTIRVLENVNLTIKKGEVFGLVGESGSGKTMTALSIMRLIPPSGKILSGKILFEGNDLLQLSDEQMTSIRGNKISMIFQEPMTSLNPVFRVGDQVAEILSIHTDLSKKELEGKTLELLKNVGFDTPGQTYIKYPHQLSGGQRQRILIAISIACKPSLIIADEPTTALDVATEGQILCLLQDLIQRNRGSMLFITHNLHIMKNTGSRIGIMYAGRIVEKNIVDDFFREPLHPYSEGLLDSVIRLEGAAERLKTIPGFVPRLSDLPVGCKFHPRCKHVMTKCKIEEPPIINVGKDKWVRCYLFQN
jgi:peptide/nickel transport system ATP-binding protein/oligopeptide transport system ATP-binding protein